MLPMPRMKQRKMSEDSMISNMEVSTSTMTIPMQMDEDSRRSDSMSPFKDMDPDLDPCDPDEPDEPITLNEEIEKEIENLEKQYQAVFDTPYNEEQIEKLKNAPKSPNDLFNMTDMFVRRLIKFSKHIPEFKNLIQEDQIHLLKVTSCSPSQN